MAKRVILHVGSMKSGTSYLQKLMMANRALLAERGILLPGRVWRDQVDGVAEVLARARVAVVPPEGSWQALVDEIRDWEHTGLISMEFLGPIGIKKIDRVVSSFPEGTVEAVVTARDLNRNIPAMWQENLKNGGSSTFEEYVAAIRADEGPGKTFWREQAVGAMCQRWSDVIGADRVTVVTVPRPGAPREELWQRFSQAIGVDGSGVEVPDSVNESLGAVSVEVLRRLNERVDDFAFSQYAPTIKHHLAKNVLARRRSEEPAVGFPVPPWLPELSARMIGRIERLGVRVVGDLADLQPVAVNGTDPGGPTTDQHLDAAIDALEASIRRQLRRDERLSAAGPAQSG